MGFVSRIFVPIAALLLFSATASANDAELRKFIENLIDNNYEMVLELFPDAVEAADLPPTKTTPDPLRRNQLTQKVLQSLKNNQGVTSHQLDEIDSVLPGKVVGYDEYGAATIDATDLMGSFFRKRYGSEPFQIFKKHYAKMVEESHGTPYQFTYTWASWGQHHVLSEAHANVKRASRLFMTTEFDRFLKMSPGMSDMINLFLHLPDSDSFYMPYRNRLAQEMYARIRSGSASEADYLNWHWFKRACPHGLDFGALQIPRGSLKADLDEFAAKFYRRDFPRAVASWLTRSPFDLPTNAHGGRFNDFSSADSFDWYQKLVGKVLQIALVEKEIPMEDMTRRIFTTVRNEYPSVPQEFGPSLPRGILETALQYGFRQIDRSDEWTKVAEAIVQDLNRKTPKPKKKEDGDCDFRDLSGM